MARGAGMDRIRDTIPLETPALADWFWRRAGGGPEFPRDILTAAAWSLPLCVIELPDLTVSSVGDWLRTRDIPIPNLPTRILRACLVARGGEGVLLLDANDSADERRFSAAHEIGHFLRDHVLPRERILHRLGSDPLAVLDGERAASTAERLDALLAGMLPRPWTHLLERDANGGIRSGAVAASEQSADGLAIELLAPLTEVERRFGEVLVPESPELRNLLGERLALDFGLPDAIARSYAGWILRRQEARRPLRHWLGGIVSSDSPHPSPNRCRISAARAEQTMPED